MRDKKNHIFIDCGPLGLKGRGGHGHNDLLSFEAVLDGISLITDCGAYLYTANYIQRNIFRSTASHNTPQIDGEEINRFIRPDYLWTFHPDAQPEVKSWVTTPVYDLFCGTHTGYERLKSPVKPIRTIKLDHKTSELIIEDRFEGKGSHEILIPFHLHPTVSAIRKEDYFLLQTDAGSFIFKWETARQWDVFCESTCISPSYGVIEEAQKIVFKYKGEMGMKIKVFITKLGKL